MKLHPNTDNNQTSSNLVSIVGYGTFITQGHWKNKSNIEVCLVENYIRILPKGNWFPYILPLKNASFRALKFDVNENELEELDRYEGVRDGLFKRAEISIILKNNTKSMAFIYIPTEKTIISKKLDTNLDKTDCWVEIIKNSPEIVKKFPDLVL